MIKQPDAYHNRAENYTRQKQDEEEAQKWLNPIIENELNAIITVASQQQDVEEATDLILNMGTAIYLNSPIYRRRSAQAGLRIRNIKSAKDYNDVTFRSKSSGYLTEINKLYNADLDIYCVVDYEEERLIRLAVVDAKKSYSLLNCSGFDFEEKTNKDYVTGFVGINICLLRKLGIVIRESGEWTNQCVCKKNEGCKDKERIKNAKTLCKNNEHTHPDMLNM